MEDEVTLHQPIPALL